MTTKRRGLVLQGGGTMGAYECGVIKALYEHYSDFCLDVVTGVSIGAVNAAVLVGAKGGDPVSTLEQMWRERLAVPNWPLVPQDMQSLLSLWGNPWMFPIRPDFPIAPLLATNIYDTSPVRRILEKLIDLDLLNSSPIHLAVTAVDIETGKLTTFENKNRPRPLSLEMVLASVSVAPVFPMTRATEQRTDKEGWYWDGVFSSNLPLGQAINLLEQCDGGDPQVEREVIIVQLIPLRAQVPSNMLEVLNRVTQLITSSKLKLDQKLFGKINSYIDLMQQIDKVLPPDSELRQHPAYHELMGHRKIKYIVITMTQPKSLTGPSNFSKATIEDRIECGYRDTFNTLDELSLIRR